MLWPSPHIYTHHIGNTIKCVYFFVARLAVSLSNTLNISIIGSYIIVSIKIEAITQAIAQIERFI